MFSVLAFIVGMGVGASILGAWAVAWPEPAKFPDEE